MEAAMHLAATKERSLNLTWALVTSVKDLKGKVVLCRRKRSRKRERERKSVRERERQTDKQTERKSRRERSREKEEERMSLRRRGLGGEGSESTKAWCYRRFRDFVLPSFFRLPRPFATSPPATPLLCRSRVLALSFPCLRSHLWFTRRLRR